MPAHAPSSIPRLGAVATALLAAALGQAQGTAPSSERVAVADTLVPALAHSQAVARVASAQTVQVTVALQPRDLAGMEKYARSVSDPSSSLYRRFLTPQQVGDRFGASASDRQAMTTYLAGKGLSVTLVGANGLSIIARGPASAVETAFGTKLNVYSGPAPFSNETIAYRANATEVKLPTALAAKVTSVTGLETYSRPKPRVSTLTPAQYTYMYTMTPAYIAGYQGTTRHIAISNFDGFQLSNVPLFVKQFFRSVPPGGVGSNISVVTIGMGAQNTTPQGEGDLDIQQVIATAPLANIRIYDSANDLIGVLTQEANDNWAEVITESYGWSLSTSVAQSAHNLHLSMSLQGITYSCASGDSGTSIGTYSYPDYDPDVLMVGGTIATTDANGVRQSEVGWSGSGGGWTNNGSTFNVLPSWQYGNGVPTNVNRRLVPDVAYHASGANGAGAYYVYYKGKLYTFSGTSCASPMFAGSLASTQERLANDAPGVWRMGRIADYLYLQNGASDLFFDVTSGSNGKLPKNTTSNTLNGATASCTPGWDFVTGWGPMNFDALYNRLVNYHP